MKHLRNYKINCVLLKTEEQLKKKKRFILEREGEYEEGEEQRQTDSALSPEPSEEVLDSVTPEIMT